MVHTVKHTLRQAQITEWQIKSNGDLLSRAEATGVRLTARRTLLRVQCDAHASGTSATSAPDTLCTTGSAVLAASRIQQADGQVPRGRSRCRHITRPQQSAERTWRLISLLAVSYVLTAYERPCSMP